MGNVTERRLPVPAPVVPAPPRHDERRARARRRTDQHVDREVSFLARSMDVLAGPGSAEERLAAILDLIALAAGASRAAVLSDGTERRVAVAVRPGEDPAAAERLAAWLDARAPRSRAERAAAGPARMSIAVAAAGGVVAELAPAKPARKGRARSAASPADPVPTDQSADETPGATEDDRFAWLPVPSTTTVILGLDFADAGAAIDVGQQLPAALLRHAGTALSIISDELATERELDVLRAKDLERTRFVSTVAHELRTPLTGLGGYLELVLTKAIADPAVEREFLERSRDIVRSMDDLVGDLLELSRLESGSLTLDLHPFSVAEMGQRVLDHLAPIALQRSVDLTATLPPRLRAATGDRRRVEQILKNLIGNALKFTPEDGNVELAGWFDGSVAVLAVRDDGLGIIAEDRIRIFERFYRMASHERITGTGLGLPIARELARAMGGDLDVASIPRAGSSFVLALPGPTPSDREAIAVTLNRVLANETERLEQQGMIRRLQLLGMEPRPDSPPAGVARRPAKGPRRPRLEQLDGSGTLSGERRPVRLRALDGGSPDPASSA